MLVLNKVAEFFFWKKSHFSEAFSYQMIPERTQSVFILKTLQVPLIEMRRLDKTKEILLKHASILNLLCNEIEKMA